MRNVNYTHHESSYMITRPSMGSIGDSGPASFELSDSREGGASTWRIIGIKLREFV